MASDNSLPIEPLHMAGPPPPVALTRSLSHADMALANAAELISALNVGDSMLINWFYDDKYIDYTLLFKTEEGIRTRDFHCTLDQFRRHWTHASVGLPPHLLEPSIADRWRS